MEPVVRSWVNPCAVVFSLVFWSGCDQLDHWFESRCGESCDHSHDHDAAGHADELVDSTEDHTHIGPNGEPLIILGEHEFHAELSTDRSQATVTLLLLDHSGLHAFPIRQQHAVLNLVVQKQPYQIKLVALPQPTDPAGTSSRFTGGDPVLSESRTLHGRLSLVIAGKPYTGALAQSDGQDIVP